MGEGNAMQSGHYLVVAARMQALYNSLLEQGHSNPDQLVADRMGWSRPYVAGLRNAKNYKGADRDPVELQVDELIRLALVGYQLTNDAQHFVRPDPKVSRRTARRRLEAAMDRLGVVGHAARQELAAEMLGLDGDDALVAALEELVAERAGGTPDPAQPADQ